MYIDTKALKTYDCKYAIPISIKKMANKSNITGSTKKGVAEFKNSQANDIRILTKECPANIFANKRIPKLTALAIYDTNSIVIMKGAITVGVPVGYKIAK